MGTCGDVVALTRKKGSAKFEMAASYGAPSMEADDLRGSGVVDFASDRVRVSDLMVTRRIRSGPDRGLLARAVAVPVFAISDRIAGGELFYRGGARWRLRRGRWRGPEGEVAAAKDSWHPLFLLDLLERSEQPLNAGAIDVLGGVEVSRFEMALERTGERHPSRPPRSVLWVDADGVLLAFAYEAVIGELDEGALWHGARFLEFGTSTADLDRVEEQLAA
jgi:hypothetical protein